MNVEAVFLKKVTGRIIGKPVMMIRMNILHPSQKPE